MTAAAICKIVMHGATQVGYWLAVTVVIASGVVLVAPLVIGQFEMAIEKIVLQNEGWARDVAVPEPKET